MTVAEAFEYLTKKAVSRGFYVALLVLAAAVNASGYLFTLWHDETVFDEAVHFCTSFATTAAIGRLALEYGWFRSAVTRWVGLLSCGVILGLAWEAFEYLIGIIGNRRDTLMDLVMDLAGALLAALLINAVATQIARVR